MSFEIPDVLWGLLVLPLLVLYYLWYSRHRLRLRFTYAPAGRSGFVGVALLSPLLWLLVIALLIFAAARPVTYEQDVKKEKGGLDMVIMLDISKSMSAQDFAPNRLDVAKLALNNFIDKRPNDRIGLGVFAERPILFVPMTRDHDYVRSQLRDNIAMGVINEEGTVLGDAIGMAVNQFDQSQKADKVVVLVTDGGVNAGRLDPKAIAAYARELAIRIFTINLSKPESGDNNYDYLCELAKTTLGSCYLATDNRGLEIAISRLNDLLASKDVQRTVLVPVPEHENFLWAVLGIILLISILQIMGMSNPLEA